MTRQTQLIRLAQLVLERTKIDQEIGKIKEQLGPVSDQLVISDYIGDPCVKISISHPEPIKESHRSNECAVCEGSGRGDCSNETCCFCNGTGKKNGKPY